MGSSAFHKTGLCTVPDENGHRYWVEFKEKPFDEGSCRHAFKGTMHGEGPKDGQRCVVKAPMNRYAKEFESWVPDIAASKKALRFAEKFNTDCVPLLRKCKHIEGDLKIEFLLPLVAKVEDVARHNESFIRRNSYVAIEPFLEGTYQKFNSNNGYENDSRGVLVAFTHWTHSISGHKFMICDLQGVETPQGYLLTDPAVHSLNQIYGNTDLGVEGMDSVLKLHRCSIHCTALGLSKPLNGAHAQDTTKRVLHTKYTFQLTEEQKLRAKKGTSDLFSLITPIFE